ncbi:hypothetical protein D3C80_909900 [compost metagenome]
MLRPQQTRDPLAGIFDGLFQLQRVGIHHPDDRRIADTADVQYVAMKQNLTRAVRITFFVTLGEQEAVFHFAVSGIDRGNAAVQRIGRINRLPVRGDRQSKVFQIGMAAANSFQRNGIEFVNNTALHILEPFGTGHIQRIAFRTEHHFV